MSKVSKRPCRHAYFEKRQAITAAAKADPDVQRLTSKQLKAMIPMRALRGRPKSMVNAPNDGIIRATYGGTRLIFFVITSLSFELPIGRTEGKCSIYL